MENNEFYVNNRQLIQNLGLNTGTTGTPVISSLCTTSEVTLNNEFEQKDFYVFCDAIRRSILTGTAMSLETTIKLNINSKAIQKQLGDIHTLISTGEVAQFMNQLIQFELLKTVENGVLTYTKYQVPVTVNISSLGGAAENEGEYSCTFIFNGKGTVITN